MSKFERNYWNNFIFGYEKEELSEDMPKTKEKL